MVLVAGVYFGAPYLIGTEWARARIETALEKNTGREATIASLSFRWGDGLRAHEVRLEQKPGDPKRHGPLFRIRELQIDASWFDLIRRDLRVEELKAIEPQIVIHRKRDGSFNFADLVTEKPEQKREFSATIAIEGGRVLYVDQKLGTRLELTDLNSDATWNAGKLAIDSRFVLNGGKSRLMFRADLSQAAPPFEIARLHIAGARLASSLAPLGVVVPLLGERPEKVSGIVELELNEVSGRGFQLAALARTLSGRGRVVLRDARLESGPALALVRGIEQLLRGASLPEAFAGRDEGLTLDRLHSRFEIRGGRVHHDALRVEASGIDLTLSGWTSLRGRLQYTIASDALRRRLANRLGMDARDLPVDDLLLLRGTLRNPRVALRTAAVKDALEDVIVERGREEIESRAKDELNKQLERLLR